jgi:hypothetical protein
MMRLKKTALCAAAALGLAGLAGAAAAAVVQNSHELTIKLPDGGTAHIWYFGDTPPQVRIEPGQPFAPAAWPGGLTGAVDPGFPADRIMAEMDRQTDLMLAEAQRLMSAAPGGEPLVRSDLGRLPSRVTGYSVVSTLSSRGACMRSIEYRSTGDGRPQVIRKTSGECGAGNAPSGATSKPASGTTSAAASAGGHTAPRLTSIAYRPGS